MLGKNTEMITSLGNYGNGRENGFVYHNHTINQPAGVVDCVHILYHEGNHGIITIDDEQPGKNNSKTSIIKLNVTTGEKEVYVLKRNDYDKFISFCHSGKVYQLVNTKKKIPCNVYDLESEKILFNKKIEKQQTLKEHKTIVR